MKKTLVIFLTLILFLCVNQYVFADSFSTSGYVEDFGFVDGVIFFIMFSIVVPIMFPIFFWKDFIVFTTILIIGYLAWKHRKKIKKNIKLKFNQLITS
jgi:hypothetical protein